MDEHKAVEQFKFGHELEAPTHQAGELAEVRHYEVMTRIGTLCEAAKAGIEAVVAAHDKIREHGDVPAATLRELLDLETETYKAARSIIKRLGYE